MLVISTSKYKRIGHLKDEISMLYQWLILKRKQMCVADYLKSIGCSKVAIYGMGNTGKELVNELLHSDIQIIYCIDRKKMPPHQGIEVITLKEECKAVDVIIVTILYDYQNISQMLMDHCTWPVMSIEDLIYESYQE